VVTGVFNRQRYRKVRATGYIVSMNENTGPLRKRRSASRARNNKVASAAKALATRLTSSASPLNLDLTASVAGYTHRGGFKLKIQNIENLTGGIMDDWRSQCAALGFKPHIAYDVTTSTATLHATHSAPRQTETKCDSARKLVRPHPLTVVAGLLLLLNTVRHILNYTQ
jgi:hypothetical protein